MPPCRRSPSEAGGGSDHGVRSDGWASSWVSRSFAFEWGRPSGAARGAEGRVPGRPRNGGVTDRMSGLKGRHQWRQHKLFKLRAKPPAPRKTYFVQCVISLARRKSSRRGNLIPLSKFAIRPILVRRTRIGQTMDSLPQASSVAFAIIGFGALPSPGFIRNS